MTLNLHIHIKLVNPFCITSNLQPLEFTQRLFLPKQITPTNTVIRCDLLKTPVKENRLSKEHFSKGR